MERKNQTITLITFLLGIFLGAMDSSIVTPARTLIQNTFGITANVGVWMITIYTLFYAVSMPIVSKLSDRYGRKKVYMISIGLFGLGSMICGFTSLTTSFSLFLGARIIQAIGGGGIMPVATAFIAQSFAPEKRGTALGLVGSIYGVATILGPTIGSGILNLAGPNGWGWLFFINIPICLTIIGLGYVIKENKAENTKRMDLMGSAAISIVILSLMYALTNMDFYNLQQSMRDIKVWPYLIVFLVTLPIFIGIEKRAEDPILDLKYFKSLRIVLTFVISFIVGCGLMGIVFIPQFAENTLRLPSGSGGYIVTLMAIFSGVTAPLGGKLIDKYSAKLVLSMGFLCTVLGMLLMSLYVTANPTFLPLLLGVAFVGAGMGFTMGPPLNYLMLSYVKKEESATALSALSLIRSIGVAISPNILINFIAQAGKQMPDKIRQALPPFTLPSIPGMENMASKVDASKMNFSGSMSSDMLESMKTADVTNILDRTKDFVGSLFHKMLPEIKTNILAGLDKATQGIHKGQGDLSSAATGIDQGLNGINKAISGVQKGLEGMRAAKQQLTAMLSDKAPTGMPNLSGMSGVPDMKAQLASQIHVIDAKISAAMNQLAQLQGQQHELIAKKTEVVKALSDMNANLQQLETTRGGLNHLLANWQSSYMSALEAKRQIIENIFQSTLNQGFKNMFLAAAIIAATGLILTILLPKQEKIE